MGRMLHQIAAQAAAPPGGGRPSVVVVVVVVGGGGKEGRKHALRSLVPNQAVGAGENTWRGGEDAAIGAGRGGGPGRPGRCRPDTQAALLRGISGVMKAARHDVLTSQCRIENAPAILLCMRDIAQRQAGIQGGKVLMEFTRCGNFKSSGHRMKIAYFCRQTVVVRNWLLKKKLWVPRWWSMEHSSTICRKNARIRKKALCPLPISCCFAIH